MTDWPLLVAELERRVGYSNPSDIADNGAHHLYRRIVITPHIAIELWAALVDQFGPVESAWVSHIEPGGYIVEHCDASPYRERWQIPIIPAGATVVDGESVDTSAPFQVRHWLPHSVVVPHDAPNPRVHVVVDCERIAHDKSAPFQVLEPGGIR